MDSIFGIGTPELLIILILAGIVMGPKRIAEIARWLGKTTATLQAISRGFATQLRRELDEIDEGGEMKDMLREMRDLQQEVNTLRQEVRSTAGEAVDQTRAAVQESKELVDQSIRPPSLEEPPDDVPPAPYEEPSPPPIPPSAANDSGRQATNGAKSSPSPFIPEELPNAVDIADDPD